MANPTTGGNDQSPVNPLSGVPSTMISDVFNNQDFSGTLSQGDLASTNGASPDVTTFSGILSQGDLAS